MAQHDSGAPHPTPDDEYLPVAGSSYEHTDANVWAVAKFGFWLVYRAVQDRTRRPGPGTYTEGE
jgi:hypothetical protein